MKAATNPIPKGYHSITPSFAVRNAVQAIDFYKQALGAEELMRMQGPDGKIGHAELKIGDSIIFLGEEMPNMGNKSPQTLGGTTGTLHIYLEDVDKAYETAIAAGGKPVMPPTDMFWGDRYGSFLDPFGFTWSLGTHTQDMTEAEMEEGAQQWYAQMAEKKSA